MAIRWVLLIIWISPGTSYIHDQVSRSFAPSTWQIPVLFTEHQTRQVYNASNWKYTSRINYLNETRNGMQKAKGDPFMVQDEYPEEGMRNICKYVYDG